MSDWIDVNQELPTERLIVIVLRLGVVSAGRLIVSTRRGSDKARRWVVMPLYSQREDGSPIGSIFVSGVTHWMPLPAPPGSATHTAIGSQTVV